MLCTQFFDPVKVQSHGIKYEKEQKHDYGKTQYSCPGSHVEPRSWIGSSSPRQGPGREQVNKQGFDDGKDQPYPHDSDYARAKRP